jgi:hypothetical protein
MVLEQERRAMHASEICRLILERGYLKAFGKTPQNTLVGILGTEVKRPGSIFAKVHTFFFLSLFLCQ